MYHKLTQFCIGSLLALFALLFTHSTQANSLVNDPFIRQHIDKSTFEPGGQNHLFGSARGSVADRKGDIYIIPTASIQAGGVSIDQAVITGNYQYNARFSGHEHDEHSPFANSNSKEKTAEQGITGVDFTSLSMQWQGKEVHPADAYDGKQGSGYPTPTGARDEYSYTVAGSAIGARLNFNDNRTAKERLKDRKNAIENARNTITDAFEQGLTHNPNLNKWGNAAEVGSAVAKGLGAAVGVPFEWLGASDAGDGIATAKDLATLEAMRELSHENKLKATDSLETVQKWQDEYNQWRAENPNKATVADTAINTAEALFRKGGDRVEASMEKTPLEKAQERANRLSQKDRSEKDFTKAGKEAVIELNKLNNNGDVICADCGSKTVPATQSKSGVTPDKKEANVDHIVPKSRGGSGTPNNGQVLCRECNIRKSNK